MTGWAVEITTPFVDQFADEDENTESLLTRVKFCRCVGMRSIAQQTTVVARKQNVILHGSDDFMLSLVTVTGNGERHPFTEDGARQQSRPTAEVQFQSLNMNLSDALQS